MRRATNEERRRTTIDERRTTNTFGFRCDFKSSRCCSTPNGLKRPVEGFDGGRRRSVVAASLASCLSTTVQAPAAWDRVTCGVRFRGGVSGATPAIWIREFDLCSDTVRFVAVGSVPVDRTTPTNDEGPNGERRTANDNRSLKLSRWSP